MDKGSVIFWKWPGRVFGEKGGVVEWLDGLPVPSEDEMKSAAEEYEKHLLDTEYQSKRREEYPPMHELVVAMWEQLTEGRNEMAQELQARRDEVKLKHPKNDA